jgi:RimJ/RimL family protein N-acetyltransferase
MFIEEHNNTKNCTKPEDISSRGQYGIWINENYWGKGLALEALHLFFKNYFRITGILRINAFIETENLRSVKFHEKAGFVLVGTRHDLSQLIYEITPQEVAKNSDAKIN